MPKSYHKLVRDKIPEILDSKGIKYIKTIADKSEYRERLLVKLVEEIQEFIKDESVEELADVLEVIEAIKEIPEFKKVEKVRKEKLAKKGGFKKKIVLQGYYE